MEEWLAPRLSGQRQSAGWLTSGHRCLCAARIAAADGPPPEGKGVRPHTPRRFGPHDPIQGMEHLARIMFTLPSVHIPDQHQVWSGKPPVFVARVAWMGLGRFWHLRNIAAIPILQ